jgi:hypothetical protein
MTGFEILIIAIPEELDRYTFEIREMTTMHIHEPEIIR